MKKSILALSLGLFVVLGLAAGCGPKLPDGMPALYPTEITITVDGQPVENALVSAFPASATFTWPIGGKTDASGKVALMTDGKYSGAPEGELTVCVIKNRDVHGETFNTPKPTDSYDSARAWERKVTSELQTFRVVGVDYNAKETSPLKMTIKKGSNAETFDIPEDGTQIKFADK